MNYLSSSSDGNGKDERLVERASRPLVVDLDETLIRTDLLIESFFAYLSGNLLRVGVAARSLSKGRARLKADIARETPIDPSSLPYNADVLKLIDEARNSGRAVYLASASNERYVEAIADYLGLFDENVVKLYPGCV